MASYLRNGYLNYRIFIADYATLSGVVAVILAGRFDAVENIHTPIDCARFHRRRSNMRCRR
jgi:hypothetical protein